MELAHTSSISLLHTQPPDPFWVPKTEYPLKAANAAQISVVNIAPDDGDVESCLKRSGKARLDLLSAKQPMKEYEADGRGGGGGKDRKVKERKDMEFTPPHVSDAFPVQGMLQAVLAP